MKAKLKIIIVVALMSVLLMGCTEADQVSRNVSKEANNFNVTRKLTVINARTDTVMLEMQGTFSVLNNSSMSLR